jgi:hypothetical protein
MKGFSYRELADEARYWWPRGFDGASEDEVRALVDEMVGLGLFVRGEGGEYRLRSPNVLRLLGSVDDITDQLLQAEKLDLALPFEPQAFRRPLHGDSAFARSPLTIGDETEFLREGYQIRLLFGNDALGIRDLEPGLAELGQQERTAFGEVSAASPGEFIDQLRAQIDTKGTAPRRIFLVRASMLGRDPASLAAGVRAVSGMLGKRYQADRRVCVVVAFAPDDTLVWVSAGNVDRPAIESGPAPIVILKRWTDGFLRRWLDEVGMAPNDAEQRGRILAKTGGWPMLMTRFADACRPEPGRWGDILEGLPSAETATSFLQATGLNGMAGARMVLRALLDYGDSLRDDREVAEFAGLALESSQPMLVYLERMGLIAHARPPFGLEPAAAALLRGVVR